MTKIGTEITVRIRFYGTTKQFKALHPSVINGAIKNMLFHVLEGYFYDGEDGRLLEIERLDRKYVMRNVSGGSATSQSHSVQPIDSKTRTEQGVSE